MDSQQITGMLYNNLMYITAGLGLLVVVMYIIIVNLWMNVSYLKKRYRKMMTGADGMNMERMLLGHIDETRRVAEENARLGEENKRIDDLLSRAITRIGVVRFSAFDDVGGDLSFAVALLDSHNDGVIISSIFGREGSRDYGKPVVDGQSSYKLIPEEEQALKEAMAKR